MSDEAETVTPPDGAATAAILMMLLEEAEAAEILKRLDPSEIKSLGKAMFAAADANEGEINGALTHFVDQSRSISALSLDTEPRIRSLMTQAIGNVRADNILASIAPQASGATLEMLRWMEVATIARVLADEHPQVASIVLAVLTPEVAAEALNGLDEMVQADLIYRAARLSSVGSDAIADLELILSAQTDVASAGQQVALGGKSEVAKIVNSMPKVKSQRILKTVKKRNKQLGEQIEEEMFTFDDLLVLDGKSLGAVLRAVDSATLGLALRGATTEMSDKLFGAMSARAAQSIRDEMLESGPVKRAEVEEAQKSILLAARRLADEGAIMLGSGGDDYV